MALSAAAVTAAAQVAFLLAGKVLSAVRAVSKAHLVKQRELQLMQQLQDKLHDRCALTPSPNKTECKKPLARPEALAIEHCYSKTLYAKGQECHAEAWHVMPHYHLQLIGGHCQLVTQFWPRCK